MPLLSASSCALSLAFEAVEGFAMAEMVVVYVWTREYKVDENGGVVRNRENKLWLDLYSLYTVYSNLPPRTS